jgi:hypothetical protein
MLNVLILRLYYYFVYLTIIYSDLGLLFNIFLVDVRVVRFTFIFSLLAQLVVEMD